MNETIIDALLSLAGTPAGSFFAQRKSSALIAYCLEEPEQKVQAHNILPWFQDRQTSVFAFFCCFYCIAGGCRRMETDV